jgi:hypothetical protein
MKICKEVEQRRRILEQTKKLKEKGLKLREISKIIGVFVNFFNQNSTGSIETGDAF